MAKDIPDPTSEIAVAGKPEWAMSKRELRVVERARQGLPLPRRRWRWVILAVLVVALAGLVWTFREQLVGIASPPVETTAPVPEQADRIQVNRDEWTRLEPMDVRRTVKVIGPLRASRRVDLSAETSGQVETVAVRTGETVVQGQALVQIDTEGLAIDLNLARSNAEATRAQLRLAEELLARQEDLVGRGVAAATTVTELSTNVEALRANLSAQEDQIAAAELALDRTTVRAPFDGVVASRSVEPGAVVGAGTSLLSVVDLRRMEMLAAAPVSAGAVLSPGQKVEILVDGIGDRVFAGTVDRIAPVAEEGTRTLTVYVAVPNVDGMLLGGMFATGGIVIDEALGALAVPRDAVRNQDGDHVLVIREAVLRRRDVRVGPDWPGGLVQVEGLEAGEIVVTAPLNSLAPDEPIELVEF